ncbi:MAG: glycosyltransferase family 39 protein [Patescibacteria group bacterium]
MTTTTFTKIFNSKWFVVSIIFLGIALRFVGIWWNLPKIYHPDETALVSGGLGLRIVSNLKHFDWPHMQMYISLFAVSAWAKITDIYGNLFGISVNNSSSIFLERPASFYLAIRFVSFLMSSLSLVIFYKGVREFLGRNVAVISLLFFALSLQNIEDAHYATLESALTFWVVLVFFFSQRILRNTKLINYALAGLFAGFATSTKYNGAFAVLLIFSAHVTNVIKFKKSYREVIFSKNLIIAAVMSVAGFFIGTPYALLDFKTFVKSDSPVGALWQFKRQRGPISESLLNFNLGESRYKTGVGLSFGVIGALLVLLGIFAVLRNYTNISFFLLFFPLAYFWYMGTLKLFYQHYLNPVYPFFAILSAVGFKHAVNHIFHRIQQPTVRGMLLGLFFILTFGGLFYRGVVMNYVFATGDTRRRAENWILQNVTPGSIVGISGAYSVNLDDYVNGAGYNAVKIDEVFREMDREIGHTDQIAYFKSKGISLVVTGDYDLDARLKTNFPANCRYPSGDAWAIDTMRVIKLFPARSSVEPTVAVLGFEK